MQLKASGLSGERYVLACNGRRVPLRNTGTHGEAVGGVRFRAWQPPSALHPTIGVLAPLLFDLIDTWNGKAIGGCSHHVQHPGGRNSEHLPVNSYEAESRREARFYNFGHTPGPITPPPVLAPMARFYAGGTPPEPMAPPPEEQSGEYPHTLDLRRGRG